MVDYRIPREEIAKVFPSERSRRAFEKMLSRVEEVDQASALAVEATNKLNEAAFVTLSANAELPNERILQFGDGIEGALTDTTVTIKATRALARSTGGFSVTFASSGDANVAVPLTGRLASQEWALPGWIATRAITATTTATLTDGLILCNAGAGAITVNLPAAATATNKVYRIKKTDASANTVTLEPNGAETIDGAATLSFSTQYQSFTVICDGSQWWIV